MIALLVVIAGYALIFGMKGAFDKIVRTAAGLILVVSFLPGVLVRAWSAVEGINPKWDGPAVVTGVVIAALALLGLVAWSLRAILARRREAIRKRHGSPRDRSLPPPPSLPPMEEA